MFAIGVLAAPVLEDLSSRLWELGAVGALNTMTGALTAPLTGRLTDTIGTRRSILTICALGTAGMAVMAVSTSLWMLALAGIVSGVPQGWGNSATNALIGEHVAPGKRGTITGIKQSGVTIALFLSGASLPSLSNAMSWNAACWVFAGAFAIVGLLNAVLLPSRSLGLAGHSVSGQASSSHLDPIPGVIRRMTVYAFFMGTSSGIIGRFLPLFGETDVGMGRTSAGLLIAVVGVCGVGFRILSARATESRIAPSRLLLALSAVAVVTSLLLLTATTAGAWILWPIAVLYALGHIAWNAVVNLAVIIRAGSQNAGRFTGIIMLGFLLGMSLGPALTGRIVDETGSYQPAWTLAAVLAGAAAIAIAPATRFADKA